MILYHAYQVGPKIVNSIQSEFTKGGATSSSSYDVEVHEKTSVGYFIEETRVAKNCTNIDRLFMSIVWVIPQERMLFNLFPEVITVDTVYSTNNEKRALFTMSGKDNNGTMFTILRAFLPNEQAWVYSHGYSIRYYL